jgi:hypothetical protein
MRARTRAYVAWVTALAITTSSLASADAPVAHAPTSDDAPTPAARAGVAVLARPGAEAAAWALAKAVYARDALRPSALDETSARVLVGEPPPSAATRATRDLADERAAVRGDDGASRALLTTIASQLGVRALIVVEATSTGEPSARVFFADSQTFDAARYAPDAATPTSALAPAPVDAGAPSVASPASDGGMNVSSDAGSPSFSPGAPPPVEWSGAVASLERTFTAPVVSPRGPSAPLLAISALPPEKPKSEGSQSHPFYTSPWFWGAVGAAVFGTTAVYFATRDNSTSSIHLELQVPR